MLDAARGRPAAGIAVRLEARKTSSWELVAERSTDDDGRVAQLGRACLDSGTYRLVFGTGEYFTARVQRSFYPEVIVVFEIADAGQHYHVPVLLSPFAYSTYRGS